jgi:hypothetical protein
MDHGTILRAITNAATNMKRLNPDCLFREVLPIELMKKITSDWFALLTWYIGIMEFWSLVSKSGWVPQYLVTLYISRGE